MSIFDCEVPLTRWERARIAALLTRGATRQLSKDEDIPTPDIDRAIERVKDGARRRAKQQKR